MCLPLRCGSFEIISASEALPADGIHKFSRLDVALQWLLPLKRDPIFMSGLRQMLGRSDSAVFRLGDDELLRVAGSKIAGGEMLVRSIRRPEPTGVPATAPPAVKEGPIANEAPRNAKELLLLKETLAHHRTNAIISNNPALADKPRLTAHYGGPESGWVKMKGPNWVIDFVGTEIHYFKNLISGRVVEWKFARDPIEPGHPLLHQPDYGDRCESPLLSHKKRG